MTQPKRLRATADAGFTLIELVVSVAIMGIVVVALTAVVFSYLRTTVDTEARLTESHDVQFAAAYWQRDVASIGVRSTTYDSNDTVHSFPLQQSVDVTPACALPTGDSVVTLAWSQYDVSDPDHPATVTVSYLAAASGSRFRLTRVRCTGSHVDSTVPVADNLASLPTVQCDDSAAKCHDATVPAVVTMQLATKDPKGPGADRYTATLTGERRQT